mgnify:FL=1
MQTTHKDDSILLDIISKAKNLKKVLRECNCTCETEFLFLPLSTRDLCLGYLFDIHELADNLSEDIKGKLIFMESHFMVQVLKETGCTTSIISPSLTYRVIKPILDFVS